jgi:hypothetical protein
VIRLYNSTKACSFVYLRRQQNSSITMMPAEAVIAVATATTATTTIQSLVPPPPPSTAHAHMHHTRPQERQYRRPRRLHYLLVTSSSGLPTPSTSGTSTPIYPPFALLPSQSQQQPGAAATVTALTSPVPVHAPGASSVAATTTPALREWDTQSMHAKAMAPFLPPLWNCPRS